MASVEARSWYKFDPLVTIFYGDDDVFDDFLPVSYRKSGFGVFFSKDLDEGGFKALLDARDARLVDVAFLLLAGR